MDVSEVTVLGCGHAVCGSCLEKWAKDRAARDAQEAEWEKRRWTEFAKYKQASEVMGSPGVVEHGRGEEGALWQVIEAW